MDEMAACSAQLEALAQRLGRAQRAIHAYRVMPFAAIWTLM
jgi:hypothetical protein